jgi:hypothetical protein
MVQFEDNKWYKGKIILKNENTGDIYFKEDGDIQKNVIKEDIQPIFYKINQKVEVLFEQNKWFKGKIIKIHNNNTYDIFFKMDGDTQYQVKTDEIRPLFSKHYQLCDKCKHIFQECMWTKNLFQNLNKIKTSILTLNQCWPWYLSNKNAFLEQLQLCWFIWKCRKEDEYKSNIDHTLSKKEIISTWNKTAEESNLFKKQKIDNL